MINKHKTLTPGEFDRHLAQFTNNPTIGKLRNSITHLIWTVLFVAICLLLILSDQSSFAQDAASDPNTVDGWIWARIHEGKEINLDLRCDPTGKKRIAVDADNGWDDPCRLVPAKVIADVISTSVRNKLNSSVKIKIIGAHVIGDLNLAEQRIEASISLIKSHIDGNLDLTQARLDQSMLFSSVRITGGMFAVNLRAERSVTLFDVRVKDLALLTQMRITDNFTISGSSFDNQFNAFKSDIGGSFFVFATEFRGQVTLTGMNANIIGLFSSNVIGALEASNIRTETDLEISNGAIIRGSVNLSQTRVGGNIILEDVTFQEEITANQMTIADNLVLKSNTMILKKLDLSLSIVGQEFAMLGVVAKQPITAIQMTVNSGMIISNSEISEVFNLNNSKILGAVIIENSRFAGKLILDDIRVSQSVKFASDSIFDSDITLNSAKIDGDVLFHKATLSGELSARGIILGGSLTSDEGTSFGGNVSISDARIGGAVGVWGTSFRKALDGGGLKVARSMYLNISRFAGDVVLEGADIGGELMLNGSSFEAGFKGQGMIVGSELLMQLNARFHGNVDISHAKISGRLSTFQAKFDSEANFTNIAVNGDFDLGDSTAYRGPVYLSGAKIDGSLSVAKAQFAGDLDISNISVGTDMLLVDSSKFAKIVVINFTKIQGSLDIDGAIFGGEVDAENLIVGRNLLVHNVRFDQRVMLPVARVGGFLRLYNIIANEIDMPEARVEKEFIIGSVSSPVYWSCTIGDRNNFKLVVSPFSLNGRKKTHPACPAASLPLLNVRNSEVGVLQDNVDSWPPRLDLAGFKYSYIGGFGGEGVDDMRARTSEQWLNWLDRDKAFDTQRYVRLASVLLADGHRNESERIQLQGREQERSEAWQKSEFSAWLFLTVLYYGINYGIGIGMMWSILFWILVFTVIGLATLQFSTAARARGILWCVGASLDRFLPVVDLYSGFKEFFDNKRPHDSSTPRNLNKWQVAIFALLVLGGWVLVSLLVAALTGLTQHL